MKKRNVLCMLLALSLALSLAACGMMKPPRLPQPRPPQSSGAAGVKKQDALTELSYADGTVLRMATGYNSAKTGLCFDVETAAGGITLADGVTYYPGDLKPTWAETERRLHITLRNKYRGNSAEKELAYWKDHMEEIDLVSGTAAGLTEFGETGALIDLARYLDVMPNFRAYLEHNHIARLSITGNTDSGAIYFAPYFDGVDDIERMPLLRVDWVEKLLDGEGKFYASDCGVTGRVD